MAEISFGHFLLSRKRFQAQILLRNLDVRQPLILGFVQIPSEADDSFLSTLQGICAEVGRLDPLSAVNVISPSGRWSVDVSHTA